MDLKDGHYPELLGDLMDKLNDKNKNILKVFLEIIVVT